MKKFFVPRDQRRIKDLFIWLAISAKSCWKLNQSLFGSSNYHSFHLSLIFIVRNSKQNEKVLRLRGLGKIKFMWQKNDKKGTFFREGALMAS